MMGWPSGGHGVGLPPVYRNVHVLTAEKLEEVMPSTCPLTAEKGRNLIFAPSALGTSVRLFHIYLDITDCFCNFSSQSLNLIKLPTITILYLEALRVFAASLFI